MQWEVVVPQRRSRPCTTPWLPWLVAVISERHLSRLTTRGFPTRSPPRPLDTTAPALRAAAVPPDFYIQDLQSAASLLCSVLASQCDREERLSPQVSIWNASTIEFTSSPSQRQHHATAWD